MIHYESLQVPKTRNGKGTITHKPIDRIVSLPEIQAPLHLQPGCGSDLGPIGRADGDLRFGNTQLRMRIVVSSTIHSLPVSGSCSRIGSRR